MLKAGALKRGFTVTRKENYPIDKRVQKLCTKFVNEKDYQRNKRELLPTYKHARSFTYG